MRFVSSLCIKCFAKHQLHTCFTFLAQQSYILFNTHCEQSDMWMHRLVPSLIVQSFHGQRCWGLRETPMTTPWLQSVKLTGAFWMQKPLRNLEISYNSTHMCCLRTSSTLKNPLLVSPFYHLQTECAEPGLNLRYRAFIKRQNLRDIRGTVGNFLLEGIVVGCVFHHAEVFFYLCFYQDSCLWYEGSCH